MMLKQLFRRITGMEKQQAIRFPHFITRTRDKAILKDARLQQELEKNGYVKLALPQAAVVARLREINSRYEALHDPNGRYHHTTYHAENPDMSAKVDRELKEAMIPSLKNIFSDTGFFVANLMYKEAGENSTVPPHQDWNYVDEHYCDSLNLWIPLQDVDENNGCLTFLPASHRICYTLRTAPTFPGLFDKVMPLAENAMVPVAVRAGEAILFFHATLHGSVPNRSAFRRANVVLGVYTGGAELSHHYLTKENGKMLIEKFVIDKDKFFFIKDLKRPPSEWLAGTVTFDFPQLSEEEFRHLYPGTPSAQPGNMRGLIP